MQFAIKSCFSSKRENLFLMATLVLGLVVRIYFLNQPMRFDESTTYLSYVHGAIWDIFSYSAPNNHVLSTIFIKLSTFLFGTHPIIIRLPALIFGMLAIVLTFCLCKLLKLNGLVAALIVSISPYVILFSTNARGYTLLVCLSLTLAIVALQCSIKPSKGSAFCLSIIASLGLFTMPTMLFPVAGIYLWWLWLAHSTKQNTKSFLIKYFLPSTILIIPLTAILYLPVIIHSGFKSIIANEYVESQDFYSFVLGLRWHLESTLVQFFRDVPTLFILTFIILICAGIYDSFSRKNYLITSLIASLFIASFVILFLNHKIPFERTWIFFIPFMALLADAGAALIYQRFKVLSRKVFSIAFVLTLLIPVNLIANERILQYEDTGRFTQGPIIGKYLVEHMHSGDSVFIACCENYSLFFYLSYFDAPPYFYGIKSPTGRNFYVVPDGKHIKDLTNEAVKPSFEFNGALIYE